MSDPIDRMQKSWSDMMAISRLETEIARLRTLLSEAEQREQKLQAALSFWMPGVTEEIETITNGRCGDDANLLVGLSGPFEDKCWGDEIIASEKDARAKALEEAAMRVDKLISDMQALEKFNRSYALRMTALASKDIRALQSEAP